MSQHYDTLRVTQSDDGYISTVEMHRPEALNAMNTAMGRELLDCFERFFWDRQTRVVILTGAGDKAFCVGGDLKERQGMTDEAWRDRAGSVSHLALPSARHRGSRRVCYGGRL